MEIEVFVRDQADLDRLFERLEDLVPLLEPIGAIARSAAKEAFEVQAFGDVEWDMQYPWSQAPFVHVAGLVSDLNSSGNVKSRRLTRGPAGRDTGMLQFSIASSISGKDSIQVGSVMPYAQRMQAGGKSVQPVTDATKEALAKFLKGKGVSKGVKRRLGFLFQVDELETSAIARPFIGVHDVMASDMMETVKEFIENVDG